MEHPGGRKFEVRFLDGAPGNRNYEVLRELDDTAARGVPVLTFAPKSTWLLVCAKACRKNFHPLK